MIRDIRAASKAHTLPKYNVRIATRRYANRSDNPINPFTEEAFLEIRERKTNTLVTVIEVLSPSNKIRGSEGRKNYMEKRAEIIASKVHLVELDLLRAGNPPIVPLLEPVDYRAFLSRGHDQTLTR